MAIDRSIERRISVGQSLLESYFKSEKGKNRQSATIDVRMILGSDKKQYYSKNNSAARSLGRCIDEMYKKKQLPFPVSAITYGENAVIIVPITQEEFDEKRKKKKEKKKD